MTREEQLKFCKVCTNRKMNREKGLVCSLTDSHATFKGTCVDFNSDQLEVQFEKEKSEKIDLAASGQKRVFNYIIDKILYYVFAILFGGTIGVTGIGVEMIEDVNEFVLGFILLFIYYVFFEGVFSQTPGKMITKTVVVNEKGEKPTFLNIIGRTLCRFIPFDHFSFLGSSASGFHDKLSSTKVINLSDKKLLLGKIEENFENDIKEDPFTGYKWSFLPKKHVYHLIGYYSLASLIFYILSFPYFGEMNLLWLFIFCMPIVPLWQTNLLSKRENKRYFHLQSRILYILFFSLTIGIRKYFFYQEFDFLTTFSIFIVLGIASSISSIIIFHWKIKLFTNPNYYFISFTRIFIPITIIFILLFSGLKEGWFLSSKGEFKNWDEVALTYDDFKGYPDLFSEYNAAITSEIKFEFDSNDNIHLVNAVCNRNKTWVNPWDKEETFFLLQHENYHFHITEVVVRMARKEILEAIQNGSGRNKIEKILKHHNLILAKMQDEYDTETNHSIIEDQQSLWQYKVDSLLAEYDPYWTSAIFEKKEQQNNIKYFREVYVNGKNEIQGVSTLLSNEEEYTDHYKFIYSENKQLSKIEHYFQGEIVLDQYFEAAIIEINYDTENEISWLFYDSKHNPTVNNDGVHKRKMVYENDFIIVNYFDVNGKATSNANSHYVTKVKLDEQNRGVEFTYYNHANTQITNLKGRCVYKYYYKDSTALPYKTENYTLKKTPLNDSEGRFQRLFIYNKNGDIIKVRNKDDNMKFVSGLEFTYNELGMMTSKTGINKNKKLVEDEDGIAKYVWSYDRYGNANRLSFYNGNNVLTPNKEGNSIVVKQYNSDNYLTRYANYDTGGLLIVDDDGYGKIAYRYDSLNRIKYFINYNSYDYPVPSSDYGAIQHYFFDSLNDNLTLEFLNPYYKPDTTNLGVSYQIRSYDEADNLTEIKFYGIDSNLIEHQEDVAIYRYEYDSNGNKIEARFYTIEDKPANANQGASINKYKYSSDNVMIERSYYDTLGNLTEYDGSAKIKWMYDANDNLIEVHYFNKYDLLLDSGIARFVYKYDHRDNETEEKQYNAEGKVISKTVYTYSANNNRVSTAYYDGNNNPINDEYGVHKYHYIYENNLFIRESFYDTYGKLCETDGIARTKLIRDKRGNTIVRKAYNKLDQLTNTLEGYSISKFEYDLYDRVITEKYYGTDDNLIMVDSTYAIIRYKRDNSGNVIEKCFYDIEDNIVADSDGVALFVWSYNRNRSVNKKETYNVEEAEEYLNDYNWSAY